VKGLKTGIVDVTVKIKEFGYQVFILSLKIKKRKNTKIKVFVQYCVILSHRKIFNLPWAFDLYSTYNQNLIWISNS